MWKHQRIEILMGVLTYLSLVGVIVMPTTAAPLPDKQRPRRIPNEIITRIKAVLPKGWTVVSRSDTLIVKRNQPVRLYNGINMPILGKGQFQEWVWNHSWEHQYGYSLRFRPRISQREYKRLQVQNEKERRQRLEPLEVKLRRIPRKFKRFRPRTAKEERLVREYWQAKKKLPCHRLPDLFTARHNSIDFTVLWGRGGRSFVEEKVGQECAQVEKQIIGMFERYKQKD